MSHQRLALLFGILATFASGPLLAQGAREVPPGDGQPIRRIELEGLIRLSPGEVLARLQTKIGDPFRAPELDRIMRDLWRTGEFLAVDEPQVIVEAEGVVIRVRLTEKNRITAVHLHGVTSVDQRRVRQLLATKPGALYSSREVRRDEQAIDRFYLGLGYSFVEVSHQPLPSGQDASKPGTAVHFYVNEGPKVHVRGIRFQGNGSFPDSELLKFMATRPRSGFFGIPHPGLFDRDRWQLDVDNLRRFYVAKGFFDVAISAEDFAFNLSREKIYLGVRIEEGTRYTISEVSFEVIGAGVFPESTLRKEIKITSGTPYDDDLVQQDAINLRRLYQKHSYIDCRVLRRPIHHLEGNRVHLLFRIEEGEQIYVEGIDISGNQETRDKVIRRELTFYPGEKINLEKLEQSQSNLYRQGYFDRVSYEYAAGSTPNQRNVIVNVEEGRTGSINFGFGVTSGQGAVGILALTKRNFDWRDTPDGILDFPSAWTGAGQTLILQAQPGTEDSRYRIEFREPHLFDSNTSLFLRGFRTLLNRDDYDEKRVAGEIGIGNQLPWDRDLSLELSYRYEVIDIGDIDATAPPDVFRVAGSNRLSSLTSELIYDKRRFRPQGLVVGGWQGRVSYEYAGGFLGSEVDISKAQATVALYRTLYSREDSHFHVLTLRNTFGWTEPHHNNSEVPIFERYFLGGARSLRGFRYREVGPHFGRDPIGGTAVHYGALEYTWPLVDEILRGIGFADFGLLTGELENMSWDQYRLTIGGGLLINVNLLGQRVPIALTWGEAIWREDEDRRRLFLFDIGYGF